MKIELISNAFLILTLKSGKQVWMDPWFSGPCFYGSWHNYPPVMEKSRYENGRPEYIYISHLHPDHFHPPSLLNFPKNTQIWIGKLPTATLKNKILQLGFNNIVEFPLDEEVAFENCKITIFKQFAQTSLDSDSSFNYVLDTSILLIDSDSKSILNVNDNPITVEAAKAIKSKYGKISVAMLPYSGSSLYPSGIKNYSHEEMVEKKEALNKKMLNKFIGIAEVIDPEIIVPIAGLNVYGGKVWEHSKYLHQASPGAIKKCFDQAGLSSSQLVQLFEGDILEWKGNQWNHFEDKRNEFRSFTHEDRSAYAKSLAQAKLPHETLQIPEEFPIPWQRLLAKARANLWSFQNKFKVFPQNKTRIILKDKKEVFYDFDWQEEFVSGDRNSAYVNFYIDSKVMLLILIQAAHWNNAEGALFVEVEREPDVYSPEIHFMMSFFHL